MNILVTGCKGQLGTELRKIASPEHHWIFTDIDTLDICNKVAVEGCFESNQIEVCINCAAYTAVDQAEDEPELAERINAYAPKLLADTCNRHNALLVQISTDYVFGGEANQPYKVDDPINPQSVYGRTKAEGERLIRESGCNYMIVRTAWLYSSTGKNFVKTMLQLGETRDELNVVADQKGCPTWAHDLAVALLALLDKNGKQPVRETFHFTNEGQITWYEFATSIMEIGGKTCQVNPITTDQYPTKVKRPAYSVLDLSKIKAYAGIEIPNWKNSLELCIKELTSTTNKQKNKQTTNKQTNKQFNMNNIDPKIIERAKSWLTEQYDEETRKSVQNMLDNDPNELTESFYRNLEFGTGGLRGIMGAGTNRMNIYTVAMATQGFANYIKKMNPNKKLSIAIAYDGRNNSPAFANVTADVMSANGIQVYIFDCLRPTPELSFAVREMKCDAGVMVTASHNPKEYNGYKAYWNDGGQLVSPHDKNVIAEVEKITDLTMVNFKRNPELVTVLDEKFDEIYLNKVYGLSLSLDLIKKHKDLKIVYTPIHGTGRRLVPEILKMKGFEKVYCVEEQMVVDGNFPTVKSPNPEEPAAMALAVNKAKELNADLVMATDPDADRVGIAVRDDNGEFILLNGNQTASIFLYYLLRRWSELGKLTGKEFVVKTIVTTELLFEIAKKYNVDRYDVLTGFKYIADKILELEGKKQFIGGGEESYGYLAGDFVRDKDAVIATSMIAEATAWAAEQGKTPYELLMDIYKEFGLYKEKLVSLTKKGISGAEEIKALMAKFRTNPPIVIAGDKVVEIRDYKSQEAKDLVSGKVTPITLPKSDVLQFFTEGGSKITVRPSGTEPKIKFYFSIKGSTKDGLDQAMKTLDIKLEQAAKELTE